MAESSIEDEPLIVPGDDEAKKKREFRKRIAIAAALGVIIVVVTVVAIVLGLRKVQDLSLAFNVKTIKEAALSSDICYERLGYLCDKFPARLSGSESLEDALEWIRDEMINDGLDNVQTEEVLVPNWKRGDIETLRMTAPMSKPMNILALGGSVATPDISGLTGQVVIVSNFTDLDDKKDLVNGKIVLYNVPFTNYGITVQYRTLGADRASAYGAIASLTRSVTTFSLQTPHTGTVYYENGSPKIPAVAVTVEDAELMQRIHDRGENITVHLVLNCSQEADAISHNVMAEITGSEYPDEIVVIGGHIDSWDVGEGAQDDGGGAFIAWEVVRLLKELSNSSEGLRPKRTIRAVMWTNEENGGQGGLQYLFNHAKEVENTIAAIESDSGVFNPTHMGFTGSGDKGDEGLVYVQEIASKYMQDILPEGVQDGGGGADIEPLMNYGVPGMSMSNEGGKAPEYKYFYYHHTDADTFDKVDKVELQKNVAVMAIMSYALANEETVVPLQRKPFYKTLKVNDFYTLEWGSVEGLDLITFRITVKAHVWGGLGLCSDNCESSSLMAGGDFYIATFHNGSILSVDDYYSNRTGNGAPYKDEELGGVDNVLSFSGTQQVVNGDNVTIIHFSRRLDTGDLYDQVITPTNMTVLWAFGTSNNFGYHGQERRGSFSVNFLEEED